MKTLLIDADSLLYKAGSAGTARQCEQEIDNIVALLQVCGGKPEKTLLFVESEVHKRCFRHELAKTKPYKGNRKPNSPRPALYQYARDYVAANYRVIYSTPDLESDDMVAIEAAKLSPEEVVIGYIDKDLLQLPYLLINYQKWGLLPADRLRAHLALWHQVLMGDTADNVPGCPGVGKVAAARILKDAIEGSDDWTEDEVVQKLYVDVKCEYLMRGCMEEMFTEQFALLFLEGGLAANYTDYLTKYSVRTPDKPLKIKKQKVTK